MLTGSCLSTVSSHLPSKSHTTIRYKVFFLKVLDSKVCVYCTCNKVTIGVCCISYNFDLPCNFSAERLVLFPQISLISVPCMKNAEVELTTLPGSPFEAFGRQEQHVKVITSYE